MIALSLDKIYNNSAFQIELQQCLATFDHGDMKLC